MSREECVDDSHHEEKRRDAPGQGKIGRVTLVTETVDDDPSQVLGIGVVDDG